MAECPIEGPPKTVNRTIPTFDKKELTFVCISDTHSFITKEFMQKVPSGDVLIHAGDFTKLGHVNEVRDFNKLLGNLKHPVKIVIAGNHEACMTPKWRDPKKVQYLKQYFGVERTRDLLTNCIYLEDESIEVSGIKIYGTPWTIKYYSSSFSCEAGQDLRAKWDKIPLDTDILVTHSPPKGILDRIKNGTEAGCPELLDVVQNHVKPTVHLFGHIHESYGQHRDRGVTTFINASTCNRNYDPVNPPVVFKLPNPDFKSKGPEDARAKSS